MTPGARLGMLYDEQKPEVVMRSFRVVSTISVVALSVLTGCVANAGYLMETYGGKPHETMELSGGSFWVWDRPDLGKLMTSPSPGTIAGPALISGLTLSAVNVDPTLAVHQAVARLWFEKTNRKCEIKTSFEIARPEFEHGYICNKKP
jgi:hypothetical protein